MKRRDAAAEVHPQAAETPKGMKSPAGRPVKRIDIEEGSKITIKYRVSFERFMNKEQAST